ncbi:hypothetical protein OGAPHI_000657 [Ogataea philodendri]|uniref:Uncharacterized protein n=1 Tax=Ogataea philodendri TaxID=1378263 RepID=A0A9P8PFG5_9ASCO|nr:uncharacterized protein OGAPHI_000657 [Ogataea philodendri]KAH3670946.1 hypothetical protein OGAPHI_000657 [Ogataea philodendri]
MRHWCSKLVRARQGGCGGAAEYKDGGAIFLDSWTAAAEAAGKEHRKHAVRLWKLENPQDGQFQSPGRGLFLDEGNGAKISCALSRIEADDGWTSMILSLKTLPVIAKESRASSWEENTTNPVHVDFELEDCDPTLLLRLLALVTDPARLLFWVSETGDLIDQKAMGLPPYWVNHVSRLLCVVSSGSFRSNRTSSPARRGIAKLNDWPYDSFTGWISATSIPKEVQICVKFKPRYCSGSKEMYCWFLMYSFFRSKCLERSRYAGS